MMTILRSRSDTLDATRSNLLLRLLGQPAITKDDVAALRASEIVAGLQSDGEAELVFAIERGASEKCREWGDLLVELVTDFAIWGERPTGVVTNERATWLMDQIGETPTLSCLIALIAITDEAHDLPAWFVPSVRVRASKVFGQNAGKGLRRAA